MLLTLLAHGSGGGGAGAAGALLLVVIAFVLSLVVYHAFQSRQLDNQQKPIPPKEPAAATPCPAPNTPSAQTAPAVAVPGPIKRTKTCPIGRAFFAAHAKPVSVAIEGQQLPMDAQPVSFATRNFGWTYKGNTSVTVNGTEVPCWVTRLSAPRTCLSRLRPPSRHNPHRQGQSRSPCLRT